MLKSPRLAANSCRFFLIIAVLSAISGRALAGTTGTFTSECGYTGDGGSYRKAVKTDSANPPATVPGANQLTPSQMFKWTGGVGTITSRTPRQGRENEWIQITGRVAAFIIEADGDVHLELVDADNSSPVKTDVEIPAGQTWCPIRQRVFAWVKPKFPVVTSRTLLAMGSHPLITVVGKAFWDGQHAPKAAARGGPRPNRRTYDAQCSAWEVHPVMRLIAATP